MRWRGGTSGEDCECHGESLGLVGRFDIWDLRKTDIEAVDSDQSECGDLTASGGRSLVYDGLLNHLICSS